MTLWSVTIGQSGTPVRTQDRVSYIKINEKFGFKEVTIRVTNPTSAEQTQFTGRKDASIVVVKRGTETIFEGFIEDRENGDNYVEYYGRSFLVLLGYSTASTTVGNETEAEYENDDGKYIIEDLIDKYCVEQDAEISHSIVFDQVYGGKVTLHGKKCFQIISSMCKEYGKDLWSTVSYDGTDINHKIINVGARERGSSSSKHMTLTGGIDFKSIPKIKYNTTNVINRLRIIGGGSGKEKVSVIVEDDISIIAIGPIEGEPYHNNMIRSIATAESIGTAIIEAKRDPVQEIDLNLITYINDLQYGDWVEIIDAYTGLNTIKRIKSITITYSDNAVDKMSLEVGEKFDDYQNIIRDLTQGDVDEELAMAMGGGSLRVTAINPPDNYVRIDGGNWYGTDGILYSWDDTYCVFWENSNTPPPWNAHTAGNYCKAMIHIKDAALSHSDIIYTTNMTDIAHVGYPDVEDAKAEVIPSIDGYTPICEVILKCLDGDYTVCPITELDEGDSFIYRDARPIVGSSSAGWGSAVWNKDVSDNGALNADITAVDMNTKSITDRTGNLTFEVPTGSSFIFKKV